MPADREAEKNLKAGCRVISMLRLGGLHHSYDLAALVVAKKISPQG
jgi:hypothetical protein